MEATLVGIIVLRPFRNDAVSKPDIVKQERQILNQKITDSSKHKLANKNDVLSSEKGARFYENHQGFDLLEKLIAYGQQQGGGGGDDSEEERLKHKRKKRLHL